MIKSWFRDSDMADDRWERLKQDMAEGHLSEAEDEDIDQLEREFNQMKETISKQSEQIRKLKSENNGVKKLIDELKELGVLEVSQ